MTDPDGDGAEPPRPPGGGPPILATLTALWFGTGLLRPAPGTWGSLVALAIGCGLWWIDPTALYAGAALAAVSGVWAADAYERGAGRHDAPEVVIDEVAGQWVALAALPLSGAALTLQGAAAAFLLFRLFDIWKPGPIGWADRRLPGGLGVMVDDLLAGAAAGAILWALVEFGGLL